MNKNFDISFAKELDLNDPLFTNREKFHIPKYKDSDSIYFTGNSLGLQLKNQNRYLNTTLLQIHLVYEHCYRQHEVS